MQVCENRIGRESLLKSWHGDVPVETACAEAHIEDNSTLAARHHGRIDLAVVKQLFAMAGIAVSVDVAGSQLVEQQRVDVSLLIQISEVDHHRKTGESACLYRVLNRFPAGPVKMR